MVFEIGDWVVYPAFGIGRVVGLVSRSFNEPGSRMYYEVSSERSTVWVQVAESDAGGLRPLTHKSELAHFRAVLRSQPATMNGDFRQRRLDVRDQLRGGSLQALCEVVRDLSARAWVKPLSENDSNALRTSADALCREWAAADATTIAQATQEVNTLLLEAKRANQG